MVLIMPFGRKKWKICFIVKNFYKPVFTFVKTDNKIDEELNLLHRQVCGFIRQWVDDNVLNYISGETHARTL